MLHFKQPIYLLVFLLLGTANIPNSVPQKLMNYVAKQTGKKGHSLLPLDSLASYYALNIDGELAQIIYFGRVNTCRSGGCNMKREDNNSEYFEYFVAYNTKAEIKELVVYNYQASRGDQMTLKGWLRQFRGYNGTFPLTIGKNIDAISGATTSSQAMVDELRERTGLLIKYLISQ